MTFPHGTSCSGCRTEHRCNYCGHSFVWSERCTHGRCPQCHHTICTPGGATYPGHGSGLRYEELGRIIQNEARDHNRI